MMYSTTTYSVLSLTVWKDSHISWQTHKTCHRVDRKKRGKKSVWVVKNICFFHDMLQIQREECTMLWYQKYAVPIHEFLPLSLPEFVVRFYGIVPILDDINKARKALFCFLRRL